MNKLLTLETKINQKMKELETNSMETIEYLNEYNSDLEKRDVICLLDEIPDILKTLNKLLTIYVERTRLCCFCHR